MKECDCGWVCRLSVSALAFSVLLGGAPVSALGIPAPESICADAPATPAPAEPAAKAGASDIIVRARRHATPADPLAVVNATSYDVTQAVDKAVVGPVSLGYSRIVPKPVRSGVRNALNNLGEPAVFLNCLIQLKPGKAGETLGRFTVNSTIGAAGLFDMAKRRPFHLPRRRNGFADSLGYYGVKPGPFLFLPLIGPTTLRDLVGNTLDRFILPTAIGAPFNRLTYSVPVGTLSSLDYRAEFDETLHKLRDDSNDPYVASRAYYLARRQAEIDGLRGKPVAAGGR